VAANRHSAHDAEAGPEQPDYSVLSQTGIQTLKAAEELFQDFAPQRGLLSDLPQIVVDPSGIDQVCRIAKDDPRLDLKMLLCLSCVDYEDHFQLVYFLHSLDREQTLVVKTEVSYEDPVLPSVSHVWAAAEWYEREASDLFGVKFDGNPDSSPLLLYEGFGGYPGRKSFPFYEYREF
jgi:NADH:ubiquinone oxidoreductase subunit C